MIKITKPILQKALIAGFFSAFTIGVLTVLTYKSTLGYFLAGSFGSSMVLLFGFPESPFAQPKNVFFGHLLTALVGKFFVQVCTTTPCMIRGANKLVEACKEKISEHESELSNNKSCSWMEVECLGACVNAPMMQINDDYYEDLDKEKTLEILDKILRGETPEPGSYRGRVNNEPENNRKTLMDLKNA